MAGDMGMQLGVEEMGNTMVSDDIAIPSFIVITFIRSVDDIVIQSF